MKGFSTLAVVILVVVLIALGGVGYYLYSGNLITSTTPKTSLVDDQQKSLAELNAELEAELNREVLADSTEDDLSSIDKEIAGL